jgi:hypothetical protein
MKKIIFIVVLSSAIACTKKVDRPQAIKEVSTKESVVYLKANFVLQNQKLLSFIDSFIERCKKSKSIDSSDINNNFYMLYIYQNDFFTRIKLSFISPSSDFLKYTSLGTGYFEYKERVFILVTGLDRLCTPDSSLQKELQIKYRDRIDNFEKQIKKDNYKTRHLQPFTWEADLIGDTIFIKKGTVNPCDPPPADTTVLYKYIRSIKSFNR